MFIIYVFIVRCDVETIKQDQKKDQQFIDSISNNILDRKKQDSIFLYSVENNSDLISIKYGTYFGMCTEYCKEELLITSKGIRNIKSAYNIRTDLPKLSPIIKAYKFSKSEWEQLVELIDFEELYNMKDVYGCPDCNDGGAEWIEIKFNGRNKKITIEYGAKIDGLSEVLSFIRNIKLKDDRPQPVNKNYKTPNFSIFD